MPCARRPLRGTAAPGIPRPLERRGFMPEIHASERVDARQRKARRKAARAARVAERDRAWLRTMEMDGSWPGAQPAVLWPT